MKIKNILAVRNDRFGEFLLNIPSFRALKETFPDARLTIVVNPYVKELAECIDFVDDVLAWENKKHSLRDVLAFSKELKSGHFDLCVILNPTQEFNFISYMSGIPLRAGYDRKCAILLTKKIKDTKHLGEKHEVEYNLGLVEAVGAKTKDISIRFGINERIADKFSLDNGSKTIVAIHPWTSDNVKKWPAQSFYKLAERIIKELKLNIVVVGSSDEAAKSKKLFKDFNGKLLDLTGKTSLPELAAVLRRCTCLVTADSGPMHLAASVGTPVIALFRNDIPGKTAKRWGPWGEGHIVLEAADLRQISVAEVLEKVSLLTS